MSVFKRLLLDESGATSIEYGLIAGLVAIAALAAWTTLGDSLDTLFSNVAGTVASVT
jgi:pilus assembly protein Flp/PilA